MRRAASFFILLAAALLLGACGTLTQLAYSNAAFAYSKLPPMLSWLVDDYVDMSGDQKEWVRDRISRIMQWHRSHELPEYRAFLERVLAETEEPFTVDEVAQAYGELRMHYHRTVEQALPDVADFLLQLGPEQVAQLEKKFAEDNRKFVKESLKGTPESRLDRRAHRFADHMENWLGEVTREQLRLIESHYRNIPDYVEERLADRKVRHTEVLALIRAKPSREQVVAALRRLMIDTDQWRRPEFRQKLADRDRRFFRLIAELSATLSPEQRAFLQKRIRGFMRDIGTLTVSAH